ncbi:hypothetical protein [Oerskovia enterophila]|uniref:hypothetical protein n=1 Tax=Oerskovia enterophila TaxID=43678 RepID=UPI00382D205C
MTIHQPPAPTTGRSRARSRRSAASVAFVVALLSVTLSACAPDGAPDVASAGGGKGENSQAKDGKSYEEMTDAERDDLSRKFASCMRDNGVDMPDPDSSGAVALTTESGADMDEMDKAFEACKEFLPNGGEPMKPSPEDLESQREFAKCMRENGIDMPDPDPNGGMTQALEVPDDVDAFDAAIEACNGEGGASLSVGGAVPAGGE